MKTTTAVYAAALVLTATGVVVWRRRRATELANAVKVAQEVARPAVMPDRQTVDIRASWEPAPKSFDPATGTYTQTAPVMLGKVPTNIRADPPGGVTPPFVDPIKLLAATGERLTPLPTNAGSPEGPTLAPSPKGFTEPAPKSIPATLAPAPPALPAPKLLSFAGLGERVTAAIGRPAVSVDIQPLVATSKLPVGKAPVVKKPGTLVPLGKKTSDGLWAGAEVD